eukprot:jgi/Chlat1/7866/Chrsp66S07293
MVVEDGGGGGAAEGLKKSTPEQEDGRDASPDEDVKKAVELKRQLRQSNLNPQRPDEVALKAFDSSVKRNSAVIKKLRVISEENRDSLLEELRAVNLTKYVCSFLHQRYAEFSSQLVAALVRAFKLADTDADKNARPVRKRSSLRLLVELYQGGVYDTPQVLQNAVKELTGSEQLRDRELLQQNLSLLVSFARQSQGMLGRNPSDPEQAATVLPSNVQQTMLQTLETFYQATLRHLKAEHLALHEVELENQRALGTRAEVADDGAYEKLRKSFDQLLRSVSSFAESMDFSPPILPEDDSTTRIASGQTATTTAQEGPEPVFDDEDTRTLYESLPDLRVLVPAVLLGDTEKDSSRASEQDTAAYTSGANESTSGKDETTAGKTQTDDTKDGTKSKLTDTGGLDALLQRLPNCCSRNLIDQLAVEFCYVNTKGARKRLVKALFSVPRTALELLPYYARLTATLSSCMKDIGQPLVAMLEEEFDFLVQKKDQMNIETKIKNVRFLGELCKFKIVKAGVVFNCLKVCFDDFTHHNVDVACNLLEVCGRYLYKTPETSIRTRNLLEILMRLKNAKNLDTRQSTLVENAYYLCKPPERAARIVKTRTPLQEVGRAPVEKVLRQLRRLPWRQCEDYILNCMLRVHKVKYSHVHLIASLVAGLSRYHDTLGIKIVDAVLEELRVGLEDTNRMHQQRRVALVKFLGELYNYRMIDSKLIFDMLYLVLSFGHEGTEEEAEWLEDCFRVRLVCTLLGTCGQFFDRGSSRRKLDIFLVYFQRYIINLPSVPMDLEFDLQDLFEMLRPKLVRYKTIEEAQEAVSELERQLASSGMAQSAGSGAGSAEVDSSIDGSDSEADAYKEEDEDDEEDEEDGDEAGESEETDADEVESVTRGAQSDQEEDAVVVARKPMAPEEDEEFEREFKAMVAESIESRKHEVRKGSTLNIVLPPEHKRTGLSDEGSNPSPTLGDSVAFKVLVRKGAKQQVKELQVPKDSSWAQRSRQKEEAEREEKQELKRLVRG